MPVNFNLWRRQGPQQGPTAGLGISPGLDPGEYQSLALLNALSQVQESGLQRHAGPMGSIAGGLAPLVQALIQAKGMQAQAQAMQQANQVRAMIAQAQLAKALRPEKMTPDQLAAEALQTGDQEKLKQIEGYKKATQKPTQPTEWAARLQAAGGDPAAALAQKLSDENARAVMASNLTAIRSQQLRDQKQQADEQQRLSMPVSRSPQYKGKAVVDANSLEIDPKGVTVADLEDPSSPYKAFTQADVKAIRGAKQLNQVLNRLETLTPEVLPKSRWGIPVSLAEQATSEKAGAGATEFDRLGSIEQLKGIRDLIAAGRLNQAEIVNVGKLNRMTDTQDRAMAKIKAMRDLLNSSLTEMGLNTDALPKPAAAAAQPTITNVVPLQ